MKPASGRPKSWFKQNGWRRVAAINTVAVSVFFILIAILLIWTTSKTGGLRSNLIIFQGLCSKTQSVNLWLHLLLNVCSSGILASSNFFMQVLNSPTRTGIDKAHGKNRSASIGVPSLLNLRCASRFKIILWLLFFISSVPLHVFFNGAIFSTKYMGGEWHMTVASEGFVKGAPYMGPGALLWAAPNVTGWPKLSGFGSPVAIDDYFNSSSIVKQGIEYAADRGREWERLEVAECLSQYQHCSPRVNKRDVILVVTSHDTPGNYMDPKDNSLGWIGSNILGPMDEAQASEWKQHGLDLDSVNSLWFAANCSTSMSFNQGRVHQTKRCDQSCHGAFGNNTDPQSETQAATSLPANYTLNFLPSFQSYELQEVSQVYSPFYWPNLHDPAAATLDLLYCLAEPIQDVCKVGLSNEILVIIVACILVKVVLCITALLLLRRDDDHPLVVLGDAIESFINRPDKHTVGRCTMDNKKTDYPTSGMRYDTVVMPKRWTSKPRRWTTAIPGHVWGVSYLIFVLLAIFVGALFGASQGSTPIGSTSSLLDHTANGFANPNGDTADNLIAFVISTNLPQLLLSAAYFVYNALYTHLCVAREWNSYSVKYRTLRVTTPKGQQRSTYRLQLPYRYSIPLLCVSILLHWMVSNVLYIIVIEGGYYKVDISEHVLGPTPPTTSSHWTALSPNTYLAMGYSTFMLLWLFIAAVMLPVIPVALACRRVPGRMPAGGSNSIVISAACHVLEAAPTFDTEVDQPAQDDLSRSTDPLTVRVKPLDGSSADEDAELQPNECPDRESYLVRVSRGELCWGVTKWSSVFSEEEIDRGGEAGHLSFGTRDQDVQVPVDGCFYS